MNLSRTIDKVGLYVLSLVLLFVFIIILTINVPYCFGSDCRFVGMEAMPKIAFDNIATLVAVLGIIIGGLFYHRFEYELKGGSQDSMRIEQSKSESYEHLTFLATYIIPFLGFSFDEPRKLMAYILLLIVIGFIFVRTDKYYANPTLALLGYKLFKADIECRGVRYHNIVLIGKDSVEANDNVNYKFLSDSVCFVRKIE